LAFGPVASGRALVVALSASVIVVTLALVSLGCDPGHDVEYHNQTEERLSVYRFGRYDFTLEPGQQATYGVLEFSGSMTVEAKDDDGRVVYSSAFTWEQLRQMNWEIAITDNPPIPTPRPTPTASSP
jgi:hypothetical protein